MRRIMDVNQEEAACPLLRNRLAASLLGLLSLSGSVYGAVPVLPGGATPGGAIPQERRLEVPAESPDVFPIPPVIERPLGLDEGPRVVVQAFVLDGITLGDADDIHLNEIQALLEEQQAAMPEGFTVGQLQEVANAVTAYFRSAGYVLAQAFVPTQTVENGRVVIRVLEGKLGRVRAEGNQKFSDALLGIPFVDLLGKPVRKDDVESALLALTDYPGLGAFGVFQPGVTEGTTDITIKVQQEKSFNANVGIDNHGTEFTGEQRGQLGFSWNNPTHSADRFSGSLYKTVNPTNSIYGSLEYQRPFLGPDYSFGFGISKNAFDVGKDLAAFEIQGDTKQANLYVRKQFVRSRSKNIYGLIDINRKTATIKGIGIDKRDDLAVLTFEAGFDSIDLKHAGINQGRLQFSHGFNDFLGAMGSNGGNRSSRVGGSGKVGGGKFNKLTFQYSRLQSITQGQSVLLRANGQLSRDLLVSIEQLGMGGPNNVRAYPVSEFLRDKLVFLSAEYILDAPGFADSPAFANRTWGEVFQISLFVDYARGWINDPQGNEDEKVSLAGAGLGLQLTLPNKFRARLDVSTPIGGQPIVDVFSQQRAPSNGRDPQVYLSLNYEI